MLSLLLVCVFGGLLWRTEAWPSAPAATSDTASVDVVVVPGNFSSGIRGDSQWKSSVKRELLLSYLGAGNSPARSAELVVWPEVAASVYADRDYWFREAFRSVSPPIGSRVLLGALGFSGDPNLPFNSAYVIDSTGKVLDRYDKARLVPGFEYQPLPFLWNWLHPRRTFTGFSPGARRDALRVGGLRIGVGICYEENFPEGFRRQTREGAEILVTLGSVSFGGGRTIARHMHVFALFRAAETRRWLVRSINGGLTEIIDPRGRVAASLPFPERLRTVADPSVPSPSLRLSVPRRHERTAFVTWGHGFSLVAGAASVLGAALRVPLRAAEKGGGPTAPIDVPGF